MSTPYLGTIKPFAFNFPPKGWALCNGQLLSINQNQALFSLLGTTYGGDGQNTFALPNLQGRFLVCMGNGYTIGQSSGENSHTLLTTELPSHVHVPIGSSDVASTGNPTGAYPAAQPTSNGITPYAGSVTSPVALAGGSSSIGSGEPHENRPPFLVLNFCIALSGIFPSSS
jgi:microcystin-dependent protein